MMILSLSSFLLGVAYLQRGFVLAQTLEADLCGKDTSANSTVVPFSYSNNAWGNITGLASGYQCLKVYDQGKSWVATYQWSGDATVVKAYPRMKAHPSNMPFQLKSLSQMLANVNFRTYTTNGGDNDAAYRSAGLIANVAMDLFLDTTAEGATRISPPIEIMVWPWWTPTILPLGYTSSTPDKDTIEVNGATWSLYHGVNDGGQTVYSWLARNNVTSLSGDYAPLVKYLVDTGYLNGDMWASQLQLGQEMKLALEETNFRVDASELRIVRADEGEISVAAPSTTNPPVPVPTSPPPSSSTEPTLTTTTIVAPAQTTTTAVPVTTTTVPPPPPAPETTVSSSSPAPPPPATTATTEAPESPAPVTTTTLTTTSIAPVTTTTEEPAPPPSTTTEPTTTSTVVAPTTTTTPSRTTTPRLTTTTMTTVSSGAATTTEAAPTSTTSNAANILSRGSQDSWFMLIAAFVIGLL